MHDWFAFYTLTSPILGDIYRNGSLPETEQQKGVYLNSQTTLTRSMYEKVNCSTGKFMQYGWVWTENIQQSGIKMTHLYCKSYSDWFTVFLPWPHPYLGIFAEMVIDLKPGHEKLNNVDQSNVKSQIQYIWVYAMSTDESQQEIFNNQE